LRGIRNLIELVKRRPSDQSLKCNEQQVACLKTFWDWHRISILYRHNINLTGVETKSTFPGLATKMTGEDRRGASFSITPNMFIRSTYSYNNFSLAGDNKTFAL